MRARAEMANVFHFHGVGEHDFRPRDADFDPWLECIYCGVVIDSLSLKLVGAMSDCYQEQLLIGDPEGEHVGPSPVLEN